MTDEVDLPTLPHSLTESVELLDRFSFNPRLPSFFELPDYKEFLEHDFPAPSISSITSKANQAQFPAFFYPSALVEFAYSDSLEVEEITRESGLSLYFSAETLRTIFRPFSPDQTKGDSFPLTEAQTQEIFDAAEPYLVCSVLSTHIYSLTLPILAIYRSSLAEEGQLSFVCIGYLGVRRATSSRKPACYVSDR